MQKLYLLANGYTNRFPNGNNPFQIATRILEECGEVASEVNHFEKSGIKSLKHGKFIVGRYKYERKNSY